MSDNTECAKMLAIQPKSQAIGEFLDLGGYTLCEYKEAHNNGEPKYVWCDDFQDADKAPKRYDFINGRAEMNVAYEEFEEGYYPVPRSIQQILADYFEIDLKKVDEEQRQILDNLKEANTR